MIVNGLRAIDDYTKPTPTEYVYDPVVWIYSVGVFPSTLRMV